MVLSEEYRLLESSPGVSTAQLEELIAGICGADLDAQGRALLRLLTENGRLDFVPEIAVQFQALEAEAAQRGRRGDRLRRGPRRAQQERLAAALRTRLHRDVRLQCTVDPSLIGGAVVRSGDLLIDGSLKGKLERLATELTG